MEDTKVLQEANNKAMEYLRKKYAIEDNILINEYYLEEKEHLISEILKQNELFNKVSNWLSNIAIPDDIEGNDIVRAKALMFISILEIGKNECEEATTDIYKYVMMKEAEENVSDNN